MNKLGPMVFCLFLALGMMLPAEAATSFSSAKSTYVRYLKKIDDDHNDNLKLLGAQYGKILSSSIDTFRQQGGLAELLAVKKEKERYDKERAIPELPPDDTTAVMMGLHALYWQTVKQAEGYRDQKKVRLARQYHQSLQGLIRNLTRQSKLDEAFAAKKEADRMKKMIEVASLSTSAVGDADQYEAISCSTCKGTGKTGKPCTKCYRVPGSSATSVLPPSGKCRSCQGTGKKPATLTSGVVGCITCKSSGKCKTCDGTGSIETTCRTCRGKGKVLKKKVTVSSVEVVDATPAAAQPTAASASKGVDIEQFRKEMDAYLADITNLMESYKSGDIKEADLRTAVTRPGEYTGRALKSKAYMAACHAKQVTLVFQPGGRSGTKLSPHNLKIGQKAEKIFEHTQKTKPVQVTYGILSTGQKLLLDIEI